MEACVQAFWIGWPGRKRFLPRATETCRSLGVALAEGGNGATRQGPTRPMPGNTVQRAGQGVSGTSRDPQPEVPGNALLSAVGIRADSRFRAAPPLVEFSRRAPSDLE